MYQKEYSSPPKQYVYLTNPLPFELVRYGLQKIHQPDIDTEGLEYHTTTADFPDFGVEEASIYTIEIENEVRKNQMLGSIKYVDYIKKKTEDNLHYWRYDIDGTTNISKHIEDHNNARQNENQHIQNDEHIERLRPFTTLPEFTKNNKNGIYNFEKKHIKYIDHTLYEKEKEDSSES